MKNIFLAMLVMAFSLCSAQEPLTQEQAKTALESEKEPHAITIPAYSPKYSLLKDKKTGDIVTNGREAYKVLEFTEVTAYNAGYIFLDAKKLSKAELRALTKTILDQYNEGAPFEELVEDYGMDGNPQAAVFRFIDGQAVATFEKAVREHKKGEVFTVDTPDNGWFHIVKKNEDNRTVKAVKAEYVYVSE